MVFFNVLAVGCWLTIFVLRGSSSETDLLEIKRGMLAPANVRYQPPPDVGSDGAFTDCPCSTALSSPGYGSCRPWNQAEKRLAKGLRCEDRQLLGAMTYECGARWCYVDKDACKRHLLEHDTNGDLTFSFATCGNISHHVWLEEPALKVAPDAKLRVWASGMIMESDPVLTGARFFNSQAMMVFADEVMQKLGVTSEDIVYRNLSAAALAEYDNDYTSCVYDIALGSIDLCLGVCFDTPLRRDLRVPFSSTIFSETFHLVVPSNQSSRIIDSVAKPFSPFTPRLWLCIALVILFAGVSQLLFDEGWFSQLVHRDEDGEIPSVQKIFFESIVSFLSQGLSYSPETLSGRLFAVGYGFFILVCGASYTANLASILITQKGLMVSSLEEALRQGKTVCYYTGTSKILKDKFPGLEKYGVPVNDMRQIPTELADHRCWAAIMAEDWLWTSHAARDLCSYQITPEVLLSVPAGYWVSDKLADVVSWQVANETVHGTWERVSASAFRQSMCTATDVANTALEVHHCIGVMAVVGVFFILAALLRAWELRKGCHLSDDTGTVSGYSSERSDNSLGS